MRGGLTKVFCPAEMLWRKTKTISGETFAATIRINQQQFRSRERIADGAA
jgi:hypothetical protein